LKPPARAQKAAVRANNPLREAGRGISTSQEAFLAAHLLVGRFSGSPIGVDPFSSPLPDTEPPTGARRLGMATRAAAILDRAGSTNALRTCGSEMRSSLPSSCCALLTLVTNLRSGIPSIALSAGIAPALPTFSAHQRRAAIRFLIVPGDNPSACQRSSNASTCFRLSEVACILRNHEAWRCATGMLRGSQFRYNSSCENIAAVRGAAQTSGSPMCDVLCWCRFQLKRM
jgi:hypothetical protein